MNDQNTRIVQNSATIVLQSLFRQTLDELRAETAAAEQQAQRQLVCDQGVM